MMVIWLVPKRTIEMWKVGMVTMLMLMMMLMLMTLMIKQQLMTDIIDEQGKN